MPPTSPWIRRGGGDPGRCLPGTLRTSDELRRRPRPTLPGGRPRGVVRGPDAVRGPDPRGPAPERPRLGGRGRRVPGGVRPPVEEPPPAPRRGTAPALDRDHVETRRVAS